MEQFIPKNQPQSDRAFAAMLDADADGLLAATLDHDYASEMLQNRLDDIAADESDEAREWDNFNNLDGDVENLIVSFQRFLRELCDSDEPNQTIADLLAHFMTDAGQKRRDFVARASRGAASVQQLLDEQTIRDFAYQSLDEYGRNSRAFHEGTCQLYSIDVETDINIFEESFR